MKLHYLLTTILSSFISCCCAQSFTVNGQNLALVTRVYDTVQEERVIVLQRDGKDLITHVLHSTDGDCSGVSIELGKCEINDSLLIFYSYWASFDHYYSAALQFGVRKQTFVVTSYGKINLLSSGIYLETCDIEFARCKDAIKYLSLSTPNAEQTKLLDAYKAAVENKFHAQFVTGTKADKIFEEVRKKMGTEIKKATSYWKMSDAKVKK
jgi:hypothetical protein